MTLGIMSAMDVEMERCLERCEIRSSTQRAGLTFRRGRWSGHDLILVRSGVGKVNSAMCTQTLISEYDVEAVICTGSAGALHPELDVGDILVARDCVQHDVVVEFLGLPRGQIPFTDHRFFETSVRLRALAEGISLSDRKQHVGRVLTGDVFIESEEKRHWLREELDGDCVEMEGAAVGHVCEMNDVPYLVVRAISDHADGTSDVDFEAFLHDAADASSEMILRMLESTGPDVCPS